MDIMRHSACLVVNPITVYRYGFLFNCTILGQAFSKLNDGPDVKRLLLRWCLMLVFGGWVHRG